MIWALIICTLTVLMKCCQLSRYIIIHYSLCKLEYFPLIKYENMCLVKSGLAGQLGWPTGYYYYSLNMCNFSCFTGSFTTKHNYVHMYIPHIYTHYCTQTCTHSIPLQIQTHYTVHHMNAQSLAILYSFTSRLSGLER